MSAIQKLLIANRGEIACRIMRTAHARGYRTVAIYSEADADALHVRVADEAVLIGPGPAAQSYLDIERILTAARRTNADALHPGYGFLSERAAFAEACAAAGLTFVGPDPQAIRIMGDKAESKRRMIEADVPCVPGYLGDDQADTVLIREAERIGYPIMVKAAAGGGGRGMRLVHEAHALPVALQTARSEAKAAFGDGRLLLERAVIDARHVEIQVFGDRHGNVIHLGERDCSVQRRHQKVVEEAPSPAVNGDLRARMGQAAVRAAAAIGYVGAGTVEFLLGPDGTFYFLEMNTRLQVEHPVTEMVTGLDLVALQLTVAEGKPLPIAQQGVGFTGHAMEVRLYAEDPSTDFLPQTGQICAWEPATGDGIRIDHGLRVGATISAFYDPMLAKLIAWGPDRDEARRRLVRSIEDTRVFGVATNRAFLLATLRNPEFAAGKATTAFIGRQFPTGFAAAPPPPWAAPVAAAVLANGQGSGWRSNRWFVESDQACGCRHRIAMACNPPRPRLADQLRRYGVLDPTAAARGLTDRGHDRWPSIQPRRALRARGIAARATRCGRCDTYLRGSQSAAAPFSRRGRRRRCLARTDEWRGDAGSRRGWRHRQAR
jgi:geranyl-CoA carboxylase alpha subunit